jgi:hypothetical protein
MVCDGVVEALHIEFQKTGVCSLKKSFMSIYVDLPD